MKPFDWQKVCVKNIPNTCFSFLVLFSSYRSLFFISLFFISQTHTEFFNRTEYILYILIFRRVKRCCIFIFTYAERWVLIYNIFVRRINKIHEILWKLRFRRETIAFSCAFRSFYMSRGPRTITHSRLFSNHKQNT